MKCVVGLAQMPVGENKDENLRVADGYVEVCAAQGAQIVVLPEMFCCPMIGRYFKDYAEKRGEKTWQALSKMASKHGVLLVGGSMPELGGSGEVYNTSYVFDKGGNQLGFYRKMHMFDIDIEGGQKFKESKNITPGDGITLIDTEFGKLGLAICYDMRFPELFRLMALGGADLIIVPAVFSASTGEAHWELLFRERALSSQCFMFGCSAARDDTAKFVSYAHSIAVSPWGEVIGKLDADGGILVQEIDLTLNEKIRGELPVLKNRRSDVYHLTQSVQDV